MAPSILGRIGQELGIQTVAKAGRDALLLILARSIRMFAYGSSTLILALYFSSLGHSDQQIGLFMTLTLIGDVAISLILTSTADALGRRRILLLGAVLMTVSGVVFALTSNYYVLLAAAVVGVISPSGNEIGPFRAVEESTLAHLSEAETRSDIFAWHVMAGSLGTAGGSLASGWLVQRLRSAGWSDVSAYRAVFWIYAFIGCIKAALTVLLSSRCEAEPAPKSSSSQVDEAELQEGLLDGEDSAAREEGSEPVKPPPKKTKIAQITPESRSILYRLCALFSFDSLASGMIPFSLISFYMDRKFHMPQGKLGSIMSAAWFVSSISSLFASAISKRIGPVKTMAFTSIPAAIFLALIPAPSSLAITIVLLVARACLSQMDQAPRSAFISAVFLAEERTAVMGVFNTLKTAAQSAGPTITGFLAGSDRFWMAFAAAGILKASYNLGLLASFMNMGRYDRKPVSTPMSIPLESRGDVAGHSNGQELRDWRSTRDSGQRDDRT